MKYLIAALVVALVFAVNSSWRMARMAPPSARSRVFWEMLRLYVTFGSIRSTLQDRHVAPEGLPDAPAPDAKEVETLVWPRDPGLVSDVREFYPSQRGYFAHLGEAGEVVVVRHFDGDGGYRIVLIGTDGTETVVADNTARGGHEFGTDAGAGAVTWWHRDEGSRECELWRWTPEGDSRVLLRQTLAEDPQIYGFSALTISTEQRVAWTLLCKSSGKLGVFDLERGNAPVADVNFHTLWRDQVAFARGQRRAAVCIATGPEVSYGIASELDFDAWPPTLRHLRVGMFPGMTLVDGAPVGLWSGKMGVGGETLRRLELPDGSLLRLASREVTTDASCDGEWLALRILGRSSSGELRERSVLHHLPSNRLHDLTDMPYSIPVVRDGFVLWGEAAELVPTNVEPTPPITTWYLGKLVAPASVA